MKILKAEQIRAWDQATITAAGTGSLALMEQAARACTDWLVTHYSADTPFIIVCGTGNNGGDGLAIARQLVSKGYSALAFLLKHTDVLSLDCRSNLEALEKVGGTVQRLTEGDFITSLPEEVVLIDAIFGTGLNRPLEGFVASFIRQLNTLPNEKITIDIPSGMPADEVPAEDAAILRAQHTLTFQQYKRAMLHPEGGRYCGLVHILDIGLLPDFSASAKSDWYTLDRQFVKARYHPRQPFSHKGTYGTAFLMGGSYGLMGAILLATAAAGRAGAGKVRALIPACGYDILQTAAPEAMCGVGGDHFLQQLEGWESAKGIGVGPGMGTEPATAAAFGAFLMKIDRPVVLDADALNLLGKSPGLLRSIPRNSILTPHPKEFERIFGATANSYARADLMRQKAMEHQIIIVGKDRYTIIALPDGRCYYNLTGNAGLATGGSGDVLCGMITGLLAQDYQPEDAALLGVYLHGSAGDVAVKKMGLEALLAGDIVNHIGEAYLSLLA